MDDGRVVIVVLFKFDVAALFFFVFLYCFLRWFC